MKSAAGGEPLHGDHLRPVREHRQVEAAGDGAPVHDHGARPADALATALPGSIDVKAAAQRLHQVLPWSDAGLHLLTVEQKADPPFRQPQSSSGRPAPALIARRTRSGVSGSSFTWTPSASKTALPMAAETASVPVSPIPFAPSGPLRWSTSTSTTSTDFGMSSIVGILYWASPELTSCPSSKCISSDIA